MCFIYFKYSISAFALIFCDAVIAKADKSPGKSQKKCLGKQGNRMKLKPGICFLFQEGPPRSPDFSDLKWSSIPMSMSIGRYTCRFIIGIENDKDFQVESI